MPCQSAIEGRRRRPRGRAHGAAAATRTPRAARSTRIAPPPSATVIAAIGARARRLSTDVSPLRASNDDGRSSCSSTSPRARRPTTSSRGFAGATASSARAHRHARSARDRLCSRSAAGHAPRALLIGAPRRRTTPRSPRRRNRHRRCGRRGDDELSPASRAEPRVVAALDGFRGTFDQVPPARIRPRGSAGSARTSSRARDKAVALAPVESRYARWSARTRRAAEGTSRSRHRLRRASTSARWRATWARRWGAARTCRAAANRGRRLRRAKAIPLDEAERLGVDLVGKAGLTCSRADAAGPDRPGNPLAALTGPGCRRDATAIRSWTTHSWRWRSGAALTPDRPADAPDVRALGQMPISDGSHPPWRCRARGALHRPAWFSANI